MFIVRSSAQIGFSTIKTKLYQNNNPISPSLPHGTAAHRSLLTSCFRTGVSRSAECTLTMRASICVRPLSTRPPRSWSDSPSPRPGPTSWAARRRCSGQPSADNVSVIPPCYICQGRDERAAGVCDQGCDPAPLLHLLVSFMRTVCPG